MITPTTVNDLGGTCQQVSGNLQIFHNAVLDLVWQAQNYSLASSQMAQEMASCPDPENLQEAYWSAQRAAFQIAVDHIDSLSPNPPKQWLSGIR